jgi:hypothetical protein
MSTRYGSGRDRLIGHGIPQAVPITLDAAAYAGALVYGSDGQHYRSNGTAWVLGVGPQGPEGPQGLTGPQGPQGPAGPQVYNTTAPNNVVPVLVMRPDAARLEDDIDVAVVPRGTGALLAQVPDGTAAGGNKRGANAVDLQMVRDASGQVASGEGSVISGGANNTASSGVIGVVVDYDIEGFPIWEYSTVGYTTVSGGYNNSAANIYATVGGGQNNTASGGGASIGGGQNNTASGGGASIGGGQNNTASGGGASIGGGLNNTASGFPNTISGGQNNITSNVSSTVGGGQSNTADAPWSTIPGGRGGSVRGESGKFVYAGNMNPSVSVGGFRQYGLNLFGWDSTNATPAALRSGNPNVVAGSVTTLPNKSLYAFRARVVCIQTGGTAGTAGDSKAWEVSGAIKRGADAASTALLGTPTITVLGADTALGADNATGATIAVAANVTVGSLVINVTGEANKNLRWLATIETTEVVY